jgi:threonyl-tRNA synthetase
LARRFSNNPMLTRIYGTAFAKQEELDAYLKQIEEAEKRDHRKLGRELDLFHFQEEGPAWCSGTPRAGPSSRR